MKGMGGGGGKGWGPSSETQRQSVGGWGREAARRMFSRTGKELLRPFLKTFVTPFRRPRLTAPGSPRIGGAMLFEFS